MKKLYDAVATIGKYTTKDGTEKKRYLTVGAVFENDKGQMALKLDALPTTPEWSGWISFYEPKEQQQRSDYKPRNETQERHNRAKADGYAPETKKPYKDPLEDQQDIPF